MEYNWQHNIIKCCLVLFLMTYSTQVSSQEVDDSSDISEYSNDVSENTFFPSVEEQNACIEDIWKCLHFSNYPNEFVKKLITKENMTELFVRHKPLRTKYSKYNGHQSACRYQDDTIYPKGGINRLNNQFVYIVQVEDSSNSYFQPVQISTCVNNEDNECNKALGLKTNKTAYEFECRQNYSNETHLIGVTENKTITFVTILKPSCCSCMYKKNKNGTSNNTLL